MKLVWRQQRHEQQRFVVSLRGELARSQMGEALAALRYGDAVRVQSAGSEPSRVHPLALAACAERKLDTSALSSKSVETIDPSTVDVVVTLCAEEYCPAYLHQATRLHWPMPDHIRPMHCLAKMSRHSSTGFLTWRIRLRFGLPNSMLFSDHPSIGLDAVA